MDKDSPYKMKERIKDAKDFGVRMYKGKLKDVKTEDKSKSKLQKDFAELKAFRACDSVYLDDETLTKEENYKLVDSCRCAVEKQKDPKDLEIHHSCDLLKKSKKKK